MLTESLARFSAEKRWWVVGVWVVLLGVAVALIATLLASALTTQFVFTNTPESQRGVDLIEEMMGLPNSTNEVVIVRSETMTIDDPPFEQVVTDLTSSLQGLGPEDFNATPWSDRPNMWWHDLTVGAMFRQITGELFQHLGQIAYLKGLQRGPGALPPGFATLQ